VSSVVYQGMGYSPPVRPAVKACAVRGW